MIKYPVGLIADSIPEVNNTITNTISRVYSKYTFSICSHFLMQAFPEMLVWSIILPEPQASFVPLLSIVRGSKSSTVPPKEAGTLFSRQRHLLRILTSAKRINNVALSGLSTFNRNTIIAYYAATLTFCQTIHCKCIRVDTISRYLSISVEVSRPFLTMNQTFEILGKTSNLINDVHCEVKRWQNMSDVLLLHVHFSYKHLSSTSRGPVRCFTFPGLQLPPFQ